ncbi:MAG TPA: amino acid adenylation domain-containing protein [Symbiobacteriaceae bacterium]|nr:amino acid adenylation domain-containing protein [Symbiobacteriaceae bacterium]
MELGEIETAVGLHPGVRVAVVIVREDMPGQKRLVAYVVPEGALTVEELRSYLKERLPAYMVPAVFVVMERLPITPNGKVDRRALPVPEVTAEEETFVAPQTPVQEVLASLWAQVLGAARVGIHDNFFALGGDSLSATRVTSRLREVFQVDLPLRKLFESPTVASLAVAVEEGRRAKQGVSLPPLLPAPRNGDLPLTFQQQRLWFIDQLQPGSALYNIPIVVRLSGALNAGALKLSLNAIVQRHESLRTTFTGRDGHPIQVIEPELHIDLPVTDLTAMDSWKRDEEVRRLVSEDANRPYNLATDPLIRTSLLKLGEEQHVLLLNMHHIIADGWSLGVLINELETCYSAFLRGETPELPPLPVQYADYALWQQQWLQGEVLDRQRAFWKERLSGELPVLQLPTDRPRPAVQSYRGGMIGRTFAPGLSDALQAISHQEGASPFMICLAAFKALLYRYAGQDDILVGTPVAGRSQVETQGLFGFFVNTLVLRTAVTGDITFRELVGRVREVTLDAHDHQDLPFEKLVEELQPDRSMSHLPLFQVMFVYQNATAQTIRLPGIEVTPMEAFTETSKFDLTLGMVDADGTLTAALEYNADLFDPESTERMLGHFETLLAAAAANPDQPLDSLPIATFREAHQMAIWNETQAPIPSGLLHTMFHEQVAQRPHQTAVIAPGKTLTYDELYRISNRVGHWLRERGARPNTLVAVVMEKGWEQVAGVLGVHNAGAAYLPLDPDLPRDRLWSLLERSEVELIVTQPWVDDAVEWPGNIQILRLDEESLAELPETHLEPVQSPFDLAYVIFTSGSTGQPKGVVIDHRGAVNTCVDVNNRYNVTPADKVLALSALNFDLSVYDIFGLLGAGGTVVLPSPEHRRDPRHWAELVKAYGVTIWDTVPALMDLYTEYLADRPEMHPGSLRVVMMSGDWIPLNLPSRIRRHIGEIDIYSMGGATEASIWSILYPIGAVDPAWKSIPYGRPMTNQTFHVLNSALQPCPVHVPGELYIGGIGVAKGYWRDPERTAASFITHPETGEVLYKTGDQGRYSPDGKIEFLGRIDFQVKIRGFRVELGEIETMLAQHPTVSETLAVVREDSPGDKRLVAYLIPAGDEVPSYSELRAYLRTKLPEYMVPAAVVALEAFPLTANGKVDRKALPMPNYQDLEDQKTIVAPRTPVEEILAGIWAEVLGIPRLSIHDNFFEVGGHSLLATQVVSRVRSALQVELPLRHLFEAPTIAGLRARVEASLYAGGTPLAPISPVDRTGELPLSFAQQRLWFLDQLEPQNVAYNISETIRLTGALNRSALEASISELVRRHEALRTVIRTTNGQPSQVVLPFEGFTLEAVDLQVVTSAEREAWAQQVLDQEARRASDLSRGPLFRMLLIQLADEEHLLFITMHHIISDAWSMSLFIRELAALYGAFLADEPSPLSELPVQYADYAYWQRQWLQGEALEAQLGYWKLQLGGELPVLQLPTDRPRPAVQTYHGGRCERVLTAPLAQALRNLSRRENATLFMTMLAGFKSLLSRLAGQDDIVVGLPVTNRSRAELERVIGMFVNTLALRTSLAGNPTFRDLLGRIRETALGAYTHQDVPFEKLVEVIQPERTLSHTPIFQVMFNFLNLGDTHVELPGLQVQTVGMHELDSKFDLTLYAQETADGVQLSLVYNADLFQPERMEALLAQYERLLTAVAADPDQAIGMSSLLTIETQDLLPDPTAPLSLSWEGSITALFEEQALRRPDCPVIVDSRDAWTYRELNHRSNQLAHWLLANGTQRGDVVAIYGHRSASLLWAVLGIMKAGAAFMILDSAYPAVRIIDRLQLAEPKVWLQLEEAGELPKALAEFVASMPVYARLELPGRSVAEAIDFLGEFTGADTGIVVEPDDLAYVSFTSGSTGAPKGILGTHRPLSHFLAWYVERFGLSEADRFSMLSGLAHDPLLRDLFTPLWLGATLYVPDAGHLGTPGWLAEWARECGITVMHLTPAMGQVLTQVSIEVPTLRYAIYSGDQLRQSDLASLRRMAPLVTPVNGYGTTETPQLMATFVVLQGAEGTHAVLPVGQAIRDVQLLVVTPSGQLAGVGELGEICVRTPYLTVGYLGDARLTQERFVTNPFTGLVGDLVYRTGDLGRYRSDGQVEHCGRADLQVKIRGFRVELGEIETALTGHPAVRECVVLVRGERLVAYCVPDLPGAEHTLNNRPGAFQFHQGALPPANDLHNFLQETLPAYMVPSTFVPIPAMPMTANGKVDRRALQLLDVQEEADPSGRIDARDPVELRLQTIFREVLSRDQIGMTDDFFHLGGHSLLGVKLMTRIHEEFGHKLPLATLFKGGTVERLASILRDAGAQPPSVLVPIQTRGEKPPFFAIHPGGGTVLCYADLARLLGSDQPFYGLQSRLVAGLGDTHTTVEAMASEYISAIRSVQPAGPYWLGGWSLGGVIAFEVARQLRELGEEIALLILFDSSATHATANLTDDANDAHIDAAILVGMIPELPLAVDHLRQLNADQQLDYIVAVAEREGILAHEMRPEDFRQAMLVHKLIVKARRTYIPSGYSGTVTLVRAAEHPGEDDADMTLGWGEAAARVELVTSPGNHQSMISPPHVEVLAELVRNHIAETRHSFTAPSVR